MYTITTGNTGIHTRGDLQRKTDLGWVVVDDDVLNDERLNLAPGHYLYKFYSVGAGAYTMVLRDADGSPVSAPEARTAPSPRDIFQFRVL